MTANIAYVINLNSLALMVAREKGFWLEEGLDVKLKSFNSGTDAAKALQIGEVQYSFSATSNFLPAREQGIPMQIIMFDMGDQTTARSDSQLAIVALAGQGIEAGKPATLAGKKVGTQVGQTPNDYLT
ncbi:MAG: ABC transporter substrate-binding protein, partial [Chloroflexi bacterium]|nr:ABC transporter substrate-binding protein [Chloroflexota bacterium]